MDTASTQLVARVDGSAKTLMGALGRSSQAVTAKMDDTVTTTKVKSALMGNDDVKSGQINVETKGGIVSLAGFVSGDKMKTRAVEVAKGVSCVKSVVDAMYVRK